jgi:hypothetical protein
MDVELLALYKEDVPELQRVYDATSQTFVRLVGRPPTPDQATADFLQRSADAGRCQFGIHYKRIFFARATS